MEQAPLEWNDVMRDVETERELLMSFSRYKVVPKRLQEIIKKKRADMDEMKTLLEDMVRTCTLVHFSSTSVILAVRPIIPCSFLLPCRTVSPLPTKMKKHLLLRSGQHSKPI